jgi:transposase
MTIHRRKSRLPEEVQNQLIKYFVAGITARSASEILGINKNSVALYFHKLRELIYENLRLENDLIFDGEIEVDESYFGGVRKGKRGRGASGKTPVFGLLKRKGRVFVIPTANVTSATLIPIIRRKVKPQSIVYTDNFRSYNSLDVSEFKHERIEHARIFADGKNHINGIENFWNQAKRHMRKYNGVPKKHFLLYLKECEWRFNFRPAKNLLKLLKIYLKSKSASVS